MVHITAEVRATATMQRKEISITSPHIPSPEAGGLDASARVARPERLGLRVPQRVGWLVCACVDRIYRILYIFLLFLLAGL